MRWGHTARNGGAMDRNDDPIRHAWDGFPAKRKGAPVHAICGAALRRLGPRDQHFDPAHPRACSRCADQGRR